MQKFRVIALLTFNDEVLFRTKWFKPDYRYTSNFIDFSHVDEIAAVNVSRETEIFTKEFVRAKFDSYFGPFALGGHIKSLEQASYLIRQCGAEKVVISDKNVRLIEDVAKKFGSQSAVCSIDHESSYALAERATDAEKAGAGEIIVNSIMRDGSLEGYDMPSLSIVCSRVGIPVVAAGGCGKAQHMKQAYEVGCTGAATSCIFHFAPSAMKQMKAWLADNDVPVRPIMEIAA